MIGKTLGRYQITEKLGESGIREVFPAEDRHISYQFALKIPSDKVAGGLDCFEVGVMLLLHEELQRM